MWSGWSYLVGSDMSRSASPERYGVNTPSPISQSETGSSLVIRTPKMSANDSSSAPASSA